LHILLPFLFFLCDLSLPLTFSGLISAPTGCSITAATAAAAAAEGCAAEEIIGIGFFVNS